MTDYSCTSGNLCFHEYAFFQGEDIVPAITEYLMRNYRRNISLDILCRHFLISKFYMCHLFKEETGMSIIEYLNNTRLEQSLRLLKCTEKTIAEISEYVGFNDCGYYIRMFKSKYHVTPNNYR